MPVYGIVINLTGNKAGTITSNLKDECPYCHQIDCYAQCETFSEGTLVVEEHNEAADEAESRRVFNAAIDAVESLILAHACAGIDIESPAYIEGIETAIDACAENFPKP